MKLSMKKRVKATRDTLWINRDSVDEKTTFKKKEKALAQIGKVIIIPLVALLTITGCTSPKVNKYQGEFLDLFDTVTQIVGYQTTEEEFQKDIKEIYNDLEEYHQLFDIYNNYEGINNIKTINDNAGIKPVKVDQKIIDLLTYSKEIYNQTEGYVNIVFGSVLSIWHDYRTISTENPSEAAIPSMEELQEANKYTDINKLIIDTENQTVFLEDPNMKLDVGAIAKGYAVQKVADQAKERGFKKGLISVGGNVCAIGTKDDNTKWKIAIQNPDKNNQEEYLNKVYLEDQSLVTSGNYQRYFTVDGKRYHHIINKDTLMPSNNYASVSIISRDSGIADGLSTALYNTTYEKGLEILENYPEAHALWVYENGEVVMTKGFEELIIK